MTRNKVCVIGLGSMGMGMAQAMLRKGLDVSGSDLNPAAMKTFESMGGRATVAAAQAARDATILVSVVVNAAQTEAVLFGADGAAAAMAKGGVIISSATMSPDDARRLAGRAAALGLHYLDAPISGGAAKAAAGALTIMASGTAQAFATAGPALDAMAARSTSWATTPARVLPSRW